MRLTITSNLVESRDENIVKSDEIVVKWQRTWTVPNPRYLTYRAIGIVYFRVEIQPAELYYCRPSLQLRR